MIGNENSRPMLSLTIYRSIYRPGEELRGMVHVTGRSVTPQNQHRRLCLVVEIIGEELTWVSHPEEVADYIARSNKTFCHAVGASKIYDEDGGLSIEFNEEQRHEFAAILPMTLPASLVCTRNESKCELKYEVRARITHEESMKTKPEIGGYCGFFPVGGCDANEVVAEKRMAFFVKGASTTDAYRDKSRAQQKWTKLSYRPSVDSHVGFSCGVASNFLAPLAKKGSAGAEVGGVGSLAVDLSSSILSRGETVLVSLVRNGDGTQSRSVGEKGHAGVFADEVVYQLRETVEWTAEGRSEMVRLILEEKRIVPLLSSQRSMHAQLAVPGRVREDHRGKNVRVYHDVRVALNHVSNGMCCAVCCVPETIIPIQIHPQPWTQNAVGDEVNETLRGLESRGIDNEDKDGTCGSSSSVVRLTFALS